jgi:hypothetical protein
MTTDDCDTCNNALGCSRIDKMKARADPERRERWEAIDRSMFSGRNWV